MALAEFRHHPVPPEPREWNSRHAALLPLCRHEVIFSGASGGPWRDSRTGAFGTSVGSPSYVLEESGYSLLGAGGKYQSWPWELNQNNAWMHEVIVRMAPGWPTSDADKIRPIVAVGDGTTADRALYTYRISFGSTPLFSAMTHSDGAGGSEFLNSNLGEPLGGEWYHVIYGTAGAPGPAQNNRQIHIAVNGAFGNSKANADTHGDTYTDARFFINAGTVSPTNNTFSATGRHHVLLFRAWEVGFEVNDPDGSPLIKALFDDPWFMYRETNLFPVVTPQPDINLNPASLAFGDVFLHEQKLLTSAVENLGDAVLNVSDVSLRGGSSPAFSFTAPATPFTVPVSSSSDIDVTFKPTTQGAHSGFVDITSDDPDESSVAITLSGTGDLVVAGPVIGEHDVDEIPEGVFADDAPIGTKVV